MLETRNLDVTIAGKAVCRGLDLAIEAGQCWAVLGRNGVGKTTLLHTLAGLREPECGDIRLQDKPLARLSRRSIARTLGVVFQDNEDPFPATVMETALIGRHPHLGNWRWERNDDKMRAMQALKNLRLESLANRPVSTLSGGERRRLAIATLLTQDPPLGLLDEPTNHLDLNFQVSVLELLKKLCTRGQAMLMILHDINLALRFCDHLLLLLGNGRYLLGKTSSLGSSANLSLVYQHPLTELSGPRGPVMVPG